MTFDREITELAQRYLQGRRRLSVLLPFGLFADPALDILVDLLVANRANRAISVSSACIASGVSYSTANAWIGRLVKAGLICRRRDATDGRRTYLDLAPGVSEAIAVWLVGMFGDGADRR